MSKLIGKYDMREGNTLGKKLFTFGLMTLYLDTLLMAIGFFMLVPLLGYHFIQNLGFSAALTGTILAISGFAQNGGKLLSGIAADRIGYKRAILIGVATRILGFSMYGFASEPIGFIIAAFISGLGGSMFHPASYAAYAALADEDVKSRIYALRETLSNIGFVFGPMIGMFFIKIDFSIVCYSAAAMFLLSFVATWVMLPSIHTNTPVNVNHQQDLSFRSVLRDRRFLLFNMFMMGMWSMWGQLYLAVPVKADDVLQDPTNVSYLYMAGAAFMVLTQLPAIQMTEKRINPMHVLAGGFFLMGTALLTMGFAQGFWTLLLSVLIFTAGQMFCMPTMNTLISQYAREGLIATYFGFNGVGLAIGGLAGNSFYGYLYDEAGSGRIPEWLPWIVLFFVAFIFALLLYAFGRRIEPDHDRPTTTRSFKGKSVSS